ncbi:MAG: DUF1489 family protein [Caulobacteraceae bacterium]
MALHLIKLCVGADTVADLEAWRRRHNRPGDPVTMRTRQTPRRAAELVAQGSLFWVFKGFILCRQRILAVDTVGEGIARRCEVSLDPVLARTLPAPRRAFQGWRYLEDNDAPADLAAGGAGETLPTELARQLRALGAW